MIDEVLRARVAKRLRLDHAAYRAEHAGILAAWSGGLDSTVMLHILKTLANTHGFELFAVHIDHNLRPCSAADATWCRRVAAGLGIGFYSKSLTIRPGNSTQNQARAQRYAALLDTANTLQLPQIATAHHANDAIETALINFARGTSLKGFTALSAEFSSSYDHSSTQNPDLPHLIRPLIDCSRAELEQYAAKNQLSWRQDPSNPLDHYERNRIRHHVVPELTRNAHDITQLQTSIEHLREDSAALDYLADKLFEKALRPQQAPKTVVLNRKSMLDAPLALLSRVLMLSHPGWTRATLTTALHWLGEPSNDKAHRRISLNGATATFRNDCIVIEPTVGRGPRELDSRIALPARLDSGKNGEIRWFNTLITWQRQSYNKQEQLSFDSPHTAYFDADMLPTTLYIRGPLGNERIAVEPPTNRKRFKDLWNEHHIPADIRWRWPVLVSSEHSHNAEILWLCNLRRSHQYQVSSQTRTILIITCISNPS